MSNLQTEVVQVVADSRIKRGTVAPEIKARIAKIVGIEDSQDWDVISVDEKYNLYLIHHDDSANLLRFGDIKGIIVDIGSDAPGDEGKVVVKSYKPLTEVVADSLNFQPKGKSKTESKTIAKTTETPDGVLVFRDRNNINYAIDAKTATMTYGIDGAAIRVFKHKGNVFFSTHRRIHPGDASWGTSQPFLDLYRKLGGPKPEDLFDGDVVSSPIVYIFVIMDKHLLIGNKISVGDGVLCLIDIQKGQTPEGLSESISSKKDGYHNPKDIKTYSSLPFRSGPGEIFSPKPFTLQEAQYHLKYGFYDKFDPSDPRARLGEYVVVGGTLASPLEVEQVEVLTKDVGQPIFFKVMSQAYDYRYGFRDGNPSLYEQFFMKASDTLIGGTRLVTADQFTNRYPILTYYSSDAIKKRLRDSDPILFFDKDFPTEMPPKSLISVGEGNDTITSDSPRGGILTKEGRLHLIWENYILALPPQLQGEVIDFKERYVRDVVDIIEALIQIHRKTEDVDALSKNFAIIRIIKEARKYAMSRIGSFPNMTVEKLIENNIKDLVFKEERGSLIMIGKELFPGRFSSFIKFKKQNFVQKPLSKRLVSDYLPDIGPKIKLFPDNNFEEFPPLSK